MNKRMKIKPEDYNELKNDIDQFLKDNPDFNLRTAELLGWSHMRYRWELYHKVNDNANNFKYSRKLYEYMNDNNIDTALKSITGTK